MSEFKVGDVVRFVGEDYAILNGLEGIVVQVFAENTYKYAVMLGDSTIPTPCSYDELVLVGENDVSEPQEEYTGGSSSYYDVTINGTEIRCLDIIEALNMNYAEGNAFKAIWRIAASKQGKQKKGNTRLYDAEKVVFFGERLVEEHNA